jgi:4-diphosphocytidyl-2-C-methyl-D-erythritol kinase
MYLPAMGRRVRCFAKINLGLHVIGVREDGFHEIRSILHTIDLHDTLEVAPAPDLSLDVRLETPAGPRCEVPSGGDNLVLKAARAAGLRSLRFTLTKRIPPGAGLGGGSSDAAAVLLALEEIEGRPRDPRSVHALAASLGSDVPFFLHGGAALALGRGEEIYPLPDAPPLDLVVAFAPEPLSTAGVYGAYDRLLTSTDNMCRVNDFAAWPIGRGDERPFIANDLEEAAIRLRPSLKDLRATMEATSARAVSMTGSGSAFYGIFADAASASEGARKIRESGFAAVTARSLGRAERGRALWDRNERAPVAPA